MTFASLLLISCAMCHKIFLSIGKKLEISFQLWQYLYFQATISLFLLAARYWQESGAEDLKVAVQKLKLQDGKQSDFNLFASLVYQWNKKTNEILFGYFYVVKLFRVIIFRTDWLFAMFLHYFTHDIFSLSSGPSWCSRHLKKGSKCNEGFLL